MSATRKYNPVNNPLIPEGCQDLVLYQAIMQRIRPPVREVIEHRKPVYMGSAHFGLQDLRPDVQRLFNQLHHRFFFQHEQMSAVFAQKGMVVDIFA